MEKEKKKLVAALVAVIISMGILGYQLYKLIPEKSNSTTYSNSVPGQDLHYGIPDSMSGPMPIDPPRSIPVEEGE